MTKINDYVIVEGIPTIKHYITLGWQPFGNPGLTGDKVHQVMVQYEQRPEVKGTFVPDLTPQPLKKKQ